MERAPLELDILPEVSRWRARAVRYYGGRWAQVKSVIPLFALGAFGAAPGAPANPFLKAVVRNPVNPTEHAIPVGVVSNAYGLVQHRDVGEMCLAGMADAGVDLSEVRCEVGLSDLGEWMNLRLYFPEQYCFLPKDGNKLDLRLEAFNSVDGSSRLIVLLSWRRLVCFNGLVVKQSLVEVRDVHNPAIDLSRIKDAIAKGSRMAMDDKSRMEVWQNRAVEAKTIEEWVDSTLAKRWGKKAACRVFHICTSGHDVDWTEPFAPGPASTKPVRQLGPVPGAQAPAANRYDVCQALSFVATGRGDADRLASGYSGSDRTIGLYAQT
jgi:hypothetical protein